MNFRRFLSELAKHQNEAVGRQVQTATRLLTPIFDPTFSEQSFGFQQRLEHGATYRHAQCILPLCQWKNWKRPRTRLRELLALGLREWHAHELAYSRKAYWRIAGQPLNSPMPRSYFEKRGIIRLTKLFAISVNRRMPNGTSGGVGGRLR